MVKIVANPKTNEVITPSVKNPLFGTFRVDSEQVSMENGFMNVQKRTAFIRGKLEDLQRANLADGKSLRGQIVRKESFTPFYEGQDCKRYPDSHANSGEPVLTQGRETYLEFAYTADESAPSDVWISEESLASEEANKVLAEQTN